MKERPVKLSLCLQTLVAAFMGDRNASENRRSLKGQARRELACHSPFNKVQRCQQVLKRCVNTVKLKAKFNYSVCSIEYLSKPSCNVAAYVEGLFVHGDLVERDTVGTKALGGRLRRGDGLHVGGDDAQNEDSACAHRL